jgi:hypothetical protein
MSTRPISPGEAGGINPGRAPQGVAAVEDIESALPAQRVREPLNRQPVSSRRLRGASDKDTASAFEEAIEEADEIDSARARPLPARFVRQMAKEALRLNKLAGWLESQSLAAETRKAATTVLKDLALAHAMVCADHIADLDEADSND